MFRTLLFGFGVALAVNLHAENAVVLESFEVTIDSATLYTNLGGRPVLSPPGVTLSQYAKADAADANVTEGKKSLKVALSGKEKFSADFQVKLSEAASAKVRKAIAGGEPARYILRYDVIFPPMADFAYFNNALHFGDNRDVLLSTGGKRTMSTALDLVTGLPATGPLTLVFFEDFGSKSGFTGTAIYLDNIRLVDTYAPGAKPETHVLQSFEDAADPVGGVANFTAWDEGTPLTRTTFAQYTSASASDIRVSEGKHALQVTYTNTGIWHADFTLPLKNTKLAEILKLDQPQDARPAPQELSRYTLRWDVTYPDVTTDEWINSTYHTLDSFLPIIQVRQTKPKGQRQTYSITLDQAQWGSWNNLEPVLAFISQGPQKASRTSVYYDNFRVIDTGNIPTVKTAQVVSESK